jgi:hypothetical protein
MHIVLLNSTRGSGPLPARLHELRFDARAQEDNPANTIDLIVVDAREMDPATLNAAIVWVARTRNTQPVRKAIMVCQKPPIEFVVRAIRAGINDIFERPLTGRQIFLLLARDQPKGAVRQAARSIMQCGRILAGTEGGGGPASTPNLLERERRLEDMQKHHAAESARLEQLRETLHVRETEVLARARRLDEEFARMQTDTDVANAAAATVVTGEIPPGSSEEHLRLRAAEEQLKSRANELDKREDALATRERMLREFEAMLLSQQQPVAT